MKANGMRPGLSQENCSSDLKNPLLHQNWKELLFLHWPVDPDHIQSTLPGGLEADLYKGQAFLGVVPFRIENSRPHFLPPIPGVSGFLETNVRTYVRDKLGWAGIWFYSLDAESRLAVLGARILYGLPYFHARMKRHQNGPDIHYRTQRSATGAGWSSFTYPSPRTLDLKPAEEGSLEYFLVERYRLFSLRRNLLSTATVRHLPYRIAKVKVDFELGEGFLPARCSLLQREPVSALVSDVEGVEIHPPEPAFKFVPPSETPG